MSDTPPAPEIDLLSGAFYLEGAREAYAWLRTYAPVFHDENTGLWAISTYDGVLAAERDAATFCNAGGSRPETGPLPWMIDMDGAAHRKRRKLVSGGFTPARVRASEHEVRGLCDELIDAVCERGECDLVADLAAPLPMIVIGDMLGVAPADRGLLLQWSDAMLGSLTGDPDHAAAAGAAFGDYAAYAQRTIAARRSEPTDDLVSVLVHAEIDGDGLAENEVISESLLILLGGHETTRQVISGGMEQLLAEPETRRRLVDDLGLLPSAVEEMLRWVSPIKSMARTLTHDAELLGQRLAEGTKVVVLYESANFDDTHFSDPERFDIERSPNDHLAFGFGPHVCLGNSLARLEIRVMLEHILRRLPDIELATDEPLRHQINGVAELPVRFTPTARIGA